MSAIRVHSASAPLGRTLHYTQTVQCFHSNNGISENDIQQGTHGLHRENGKKRFTVRENTGNLENLPTHRELCVIKS